MKDIKMNEVIWKNTFAALGKIKTEDCKTMADIFEAILPMMHLAMPPESQEPALIKQLEAKQKETEKLDTKILQLSEEIKKLKGEESKEPNT